MIATDVQPVSIVEDKGFNKFVKVLDPKYSTPSRQTIASTKNVNKRTCGETLQHKLVLIHLWTSRATMGFLTTTCHFINKDWVMESVVLETTHVPA